VWSDVLTFLAIHSGYCSCFGIWKFAELLDVMLMFSLNADFRFWMQVLMGKLSLPLNILYLCSILGAAVDGETDFH
jgi:hypothetical protein